MNVTTKRAFVTGGTGFLGMHVLEALVAAGWEVTALHRSSSNLRRIARLPVKRVIGSLHDKDSLIAAMPDDCDAVFHVAGNVSFWSGGNDEQTKDNVDGTRHMVEAAIVRRAKRFIHTSTESAYGEQPMVPFDETATSTAFDSWINYERSKYRAELEVRAGIARGLPAVLLNPAHILGAYDDAGWSQMVKLVHQKKLPAVPPGGGCFCDAQSVAQAHVAAVDRGRSGENYLLGGINLPYLDFFAAIAELTSRKVPKRTASIGLLRFLSIGYRLASKVTRRPPMLTPEIVEEFRRGPRFVSSNKAVAELGYVVVPLETMLHKCHAWLKEEGEIV